MKTFHDYLEAEVQLREDLRTIEGSNLTIVDYNDQDDENQNYLGY